MERAVVVTGGGRGIGKALVDRLTAEGYYVVAVEHDAVVAQALGERIAGAGEVVLGDCADRALLADVGRRFSQERPLWGWINNASAVDEGNLHDPQSESVDRVFSVNIGGYFWGAASAIQCFVRQRSAGVVLNISSVHGRTGFSNNAAYDVSKGAVDALTRYIAVEYGQVGIRANAIAPGAVYTEGSRRAIDATPNPRATLRAIADQNPLRRVAAPSEIAGIASFLLSDAASFITGQSIAVDGGLTAACMPFQVDAALRTRYGNDAIPPRTSDWDTARHLQGVDR